MCGSLDSEWGVLMKKDNHNRYNKAGNMGMLFCFFAFFLGIWSLFGTGMAQAKEQTIRVGYTEGQGFIEEVNGEYQGYGVDYLETMAEYTGWKYEYICDTWENCIEMLASGEVDLLCNLHQNSETDGTFLYAKIPLGYESTVLYTREDSGIYYEDYEAMDGARVGGIQGSIHTQEFMDIAQKEGITYELSYYTREKDMLEALHAGEVDMIVMGSLYAKPNAKIVGKFGAEAFYCAANGKGAQMIEQIDYAMQQILVDYPDLEVEKRQEYYGDGQTSSSPMYTKEEAEYIANAEPVRVKLMVGSKPLSYTKDGEPAGIFVEYLNLLSEASGLEFQIEMETTPLTMEEQTKHILDEDYLMLRSKRVLDSNELDEGLITSTPLMETELSYVKLQANIAEDIADDAVLAITKEMGYLLPLIEQTDGDYVVVSYDSAEECLDAVLSGEADIAIQDDYVVTYLLQKPKYADNLVECPGETFSNGMCLIASDDQAMLIEILNKTIRYIPQREKDAVVTIEIITNHYQFSWEDIWYSYGKMIVCIAVIIIVSLCVYTSLTKRMTKLKVQKQEYEKLQKKVQQDELTGVYNRTYFFKKAKEMIADAQEDMCVVLMDVSNFKVVNDLYGMEVGDKLLRVLAQELVRMGEGREMLVSRFNGDHFYLCLSKKDFEEIQFPKRYKTFLTEMDIKVTYGVFEVGEQKSVPVNIMCDRANIAAHDEERKQKGYIRYYNDAERSRILEEQEIENDMEKALEERQFCVYVQPKYDVNREVIVGGEALVRWVHPEKGMIPPGKFIGIFEKNGFIVRLDYYVWEETCRLIAELKKEGFASYPISINVSRAHFYGKELKDKLLELVTKYGVEPEELELEITETICAEDPDIIYKRIKELQELGFKVAMDDFGSGYSSLNMLKEMPLDIIKMDLKFLDGGENEERSHNILETLISLAHSLKLHVVVEGVETKEQVEFLRRIGSYIAQGYYYSRPVDCETYSEMLYKQANI